MMKEYKPSEFEAVWQEKWEKDQLYRAEDFSARPKKYVLIEFPYPSGEGLHVGHCLSYTAQDVLARYLRLKGNNVLYPMGWDAFGLPTENYAIQNKIHPRVATERNVANFKRQIQSLGISIDWSREINTTDPKYYKWTQWIFLQLFKAGLAEKKLVPINWCPKDKIGLAFEEVVDGKCERCGTAVEQREINQWVLKITNYADRLIDDLETVNFLPHIKKQQIDWIGRSKGAEINFECKVQNVNFKIDPIRVFTTRPDTIFGATFIVIAPEHELVQSSKFKVQSSKFKVKNFEEVEAYVAASKKLSDRERQEKKDKTGVELKGIKAIHPLTNEELPIFVADYVMMSYGTGAIMAVPAHDQRDWEFAQKYDLPIIQVIAPHFIDPAAPPAAGKKTVRRHNVHAIIRRPSDGKTLLLEWKVNLTSRRPQLFSFIVGGVDEGEDLITAAKREISEETGYDQLNFIRELPLRIQTEYYASHKNENRYADITVAVFDLKSEHRVKLAEDETLKHQPIWVEPEEVIKKLNIIDGPFIWQQYLSGGSAYSGEGLMMNSHEFDGLPSAKAWQALADALVAKKKAVITTHYKLRDWIFSRQHYWGEPIPVVICDQCGYVPLADKDLPLKLPEVDHYEPTDTGESPLAAISDWVNVPCPKCGCPAKRETDTMPTWAGSSWYFLRYIDPENDRALADKKKLDYWLPVDLYNGGMEHTTLHLLYSRFWYKFLFDQGLVPTSEPYARRISHGMILGPDHQKMSKSRGNVINPDEIVGRYGADTLRLYEMFMGEYDDTKVWSESSLQGVHRFLKRVWNYCLNVKATENKDGSFEQLIQYPIKKITDDIDRRSYNTVVSELMIFLNNLEKHKKDEVNRNYLEIFLILLSPLAPHITEELWHQLGNKNSIHVQKWPEVNEDILASKSVWLPIQINGKKRALLELPAGEQDESQVKQWILAHPNVQKYLKGAQPKKFIYVPGKIVNIVV